MNRARRPLIAGNWKMNKGGPDGLALAIEYLALTRAVPNVDVVLAPPFTVLAAVAAECANSGAADRIAIAGQTMSAKASGAFTGEISASMLADCGCTWVILGHSERRQWFGETDAGVAEKAAAAFARGLLPLVCVGETLAEREAGRTLEVVRRQVDAVIEVLAANDGAALAYEPVWAIGTGKNAGPAEAEEVHAAIRGWLGPSLGARTRVLYGGSVKGDNAVGLLSAPNVDGALVGGASLDIDSFGAIARAAENLATKAS